VYNDVTLKGPNVLHRDQNRENTYKGFILRFDFNRLVGTTVHSDGKFSEHYSIYNKKKLPNISPTNAF